MSKGITNAGQFVFNKLDLITSGNSAYDIRNMVLQMDLYEDMFSNSLSGSLIINDGIDMIYNFPIIGEEYLDVDLISAGMEGKENKIARRFYIYKLTDLAYHDQGRLTYVLHFISTEAINDCNRKISKAFSGKISTNIIDLIKGERYLESTRPMIVEDTANALNFISNYWSPFKIINYAANRAISSEFKEANYFLFETNKQFKFVSLSSLNQGTPYDTYLFDRQTREAAGNGSLKNINIMLSKILDFKMSTGFDYVTRLQQGMYSSVLYTHNILTKSIKVSTFDYLDSFTTKNIGAHLEKYPLVTPNVVKKKASSINFRDKIHYTYDNQISDKFQFWLLKRKSWLQQMNAISAEIEVYGRTDIEVGRVINLTLPIMQSANSAKDVKNNEYFSGKYIVTAIAHRFSGGQHRMNMNITKDSFSKELK